MLGRWKVLPILFLLIVLESVVLLASPSNAIGLPMPSPTIGGENTSLEEAARLARNTGFTLERPVTLPSDLWYMEVRVSGSRLIDVQQPWIEGLSEAYLIYSKEPVNANTTLQDVLNSGSIFIIEQKRLPAFDQIVDAALRSQGKVGETRIVTVNGSVITSVRTGAVEAVTINGNRGALITTLIPYAYANQSILEWGDKQLAVELIAGTDHYTNNDLVTIATSFINATANTTTTTTNTTSSSTSTSTSTTASTTSAQRPVNDFSLAVDDVSRNALGVQVQGNGKNVTIDSSDLRFKRIVQYLNSSTVVQVIQRTRIIEGNRTVTDTVTMPCAMKYVLTFVLNNGSRRLFSCGADRIWFETDQTMYFASFDPAFDSFLNSVVGSEIIGDKVDFSPYTWGVSAVVTVVALAAVALFLRRGR